MSWPGAFALTQMVEVPIYARALDGRWRRRLAVAFAASAVTHPIVWFVFPWLWPGTIWHRIAAAEAFAVAVEAAWLSAFGVGRSIWWALLANAASVAVGLASQALFGWP